MTTVYTVEVEGPGVVGVFDALEDAEDFFAVLRDPALDIPAGRLQEFEVNVRDPQHLIHAPSPDRRCCFTASSLHDLEAHVNWLQAQIQMRQGAQGA